MLIYVIIKKNVYIEVKKSLSYQKSIRKFDEN